MISIKDLSDEQTAAIRQWAADGAGLDDIHTRMRDDFGLRLTFMDARFLIADLEIEFEEEEEEEEVDVVETQDAEPAPPGDPEPAAADGEPAVPAEAVEDLLPGAGEGEDALPNVTVSISDIAAPGAMASGTVDFGNGETAIWTVDQMGRMGLNPTNTEYEPTEIEIMAFQQELQRMAQSRGF